MKPDTPLPSPTPLELQVNSLENFPATVNPRSSNTTVNTSPIANNRFVPVQDIRTGRWWKRNLKISLATIVILLLLAGITWGLGALLFKAEPDVTTPTVPGTTNLNISLEGSQQNPGTLTIHRDLVVTNVARFEKSVTVQGGVNVGGDLNVATNGSFGGTVKAANFTGRFFGDGSGLTNLPGINGNFVALQNVTPGTRQNGNINISGRLIAASLQGDGTGLTGLNASNLASGTVGDARLSPNVALLNISNTFTGTTNNFKSILQNGNNVCDTSNNCGFAVAGEYFLQDGNSFGRLATLGTNDNQALAFETNGLERLRVSESGSVGIGTVTPGATLDVNGTMSVSGAVSLGSSLNVSGSTTLAGLNAGATSLASLATAANASIGGTLGVTGATSLAGLSAGASTLSSLSVTNNASVGGTLGVAGLSTFSALGSADNAAYLCRNSAGQLATCNTTGTGAAFVQGGNSFGAIASLGTNDAFDLQLETGGTAKLTIQNSTGNVGIGTTGPGAKLQINTVATGTIGQIIQGAAGQTANLQEWRNSAGAPQSAIAASGLLDLSAVAATVGATGTGLGDKVALYGSNFGIGVQAARVVVYAANGSDGLGIRLAATSGQASAGAEGITLTADGRATFIQGLNATGNFANSFGGSGVDTQVLTVSTAVFSNIGLVVKGAASQTADLQQWQNSAGTVLARVDASGNGYFNNGGGGTGAAFVQGGNSFGAIASLGTNDAFDLQLETGGTPKLTIQNSTGNVGVGTTSPAAKLESNGTFRVTGATAVASGEGFEINYGGGVTNLYSYNRSTSTYQDINLNDAGRIQGSNGNWNIGANSGSAYQLSVTDTSAALGTPSIKVTNNSDASFELSLTASGATSPGVLLGAQASNYLGLKSNGIERIRIDTGGNVGIGTTLPGAKLQVNTETAGTIGQIIQGAVSQTADLTQWQDSAGVIKALISKDGFLRVSNYINLGKPGGGNSAQITSPNDDGTIRLIPNGGNESNNRFMITNGGIQFNGSAEGVNTSLNGVAPSGYLMNFAGGDITHSLSYGIRVQNNNGTTTFNVNPHGSTTITNYAATDINLTLKGAAAQTADLLQAQDSTGAVLAKLDATGNLTVKNATFNGTLSVNGHIITGNTSGTTTVAAGAAACTTPTLSISGNDTAGTITVTTGTGCAATGVLATVTFANAYGAAPRVTLTPANASGAALNYYKGSTTTAFTLETGTVPTDSTTYTYNYQVLQ